MIVPILGIKPGSLADALFTKTQQRVLGVLFGHPTRHFHAQDVIRQARSGTGAAHRELVRLEASGLVTVTQIGRQKHYQANPESPLFKELTSIVEKTVGLAEPLRRALKPFGDRIRAAFVYGSVAKQTDRATSDVDLMVISDDVTYGEVFAALERASRALGRPVNPTVLTPGDYSRKLDEGSSFVSRLQKSRKLWIIGSDNDLPS